VPVIKQKMNADPAAVVFDAVGKIKAGFNGVAIVDTAGRLHTRTNLMEELKKVKKGYQQGIAGSAARDIACIRRHNRSECRHAGQNV